MPSVGTLTGYLTLNDSQYKAALEKNTQRTNAFARGVASTFGRFLAPAAITAGMTAFGRVAIDQASKIKDSAEQAGLSIEQWQALDYVFRQNGASGDQLTAVLAKLRGSIADAANGSKQARENFRAIGLHFSELVRLSPAEQLEKVAKAMIKGGKGTIEWAAAADILGSKNLPKLNEGLKQLAEDGLPAATKEAKAFGQIVNEEYVRNVEGFGQAIKNAGIEAKNAAVSGFGALLSIFKDPDFEKAFAGTQWVPKNTDQLNRESRARAAAQRAELAEERRMQREAVRANEEARRKAETAKRAAELPRAPAARRNQAIKKEILDQLDIREQKARVAIEEAKAARALDDFREGIAFSAANDPLMDYAEKIREANKALATGVVSADAYRRALVGAAEAFGDAKIADIIKISNRTGTAGRTREQSEIDRNMMRAEQAAAQGNYGAADQYLARVEELQRDNGGMGLNEYLGTKANPQAKGIAGATQAKEDELKGKLAELVGSLDAIAKKLTVS